MSDWETTSPVVRWTERGPRLGDVQHPKPVPYLNQPDGLIAGREGGGEDETGLEHGGIGADEVGVDQREGGVGGRGEGGGGGEDGGEERKEGFGLDLSGRRGRRLCSG